MHSFDLKTVDKVVYRGENTSLQGKVVHDEPAKIRPVWPASLLCLVQFQPCIIYFLRYNSYDTVT